MNNKDFRLNVVASSHKHKVKETKEKENEKKLKIGSWKAEQQ